MLPVASPALLSDHVEALIKEARAQAKILRGGAKREARAKSVVVVIPLGDAVKSLLVGEQMYRLDKLDQILVCLYQLKSRSDLS